MNLELRKIQADMSTDLSGVASLALIQELRNFEVSDRALLDTDCSQLIKQVALLQPGIFNSSAQSHDSRTILKMQASRKPLKNTTTTKTTRIASMAPPSLD